MKINPNFSAFKISSKGMSIQKRQMDIQKKGKFLN